MLYFSCWQMHPTGKPINQSFQMLCLVGGQVLPTQLLLQSRLVVWLEALFLFCYYSCAMGFGNLAILSTNYIKSKCFCYLHLLLLFNGSSPVIGTVLPSELAKILVLTWAKSKNDKMPSASSCGTKHVLVCSIHTWWVAYNIWYVNHVCIVYTCICMK